MTNTNTEHPSIETLSNAMNAAMKKAGVDAEISVTFQCHEGAWSDSHGFVISCTDAAIETRAVQWAATWLRKVTSQIEDERTTYSRWAAQYAVFQSGNVVTFCSFSIGD